MVLKLIPVQIKNTNAGKKIKYAERGNRMLNGKVCGTGI